MVRSRDGGRVLCLLLLERGLLIVELRLWRL